MAKKERVKVPGNRLVDTIKQLVKRGDVQKICLINEEKHLLDVPVRTRDPASPAGVLEGPVLAAIAAFSSLVNECTVEVETKKKPPG